MQRLAAIRSCLGDQIASRGNLRIDKTSVNLDPITQDALRLCTRMSIGHGRVAIFYPYSGVEMQVLAATEFLYQSSYVRPARRQKVMIITDDIWNTESYYSSLRVGDEPISSFFGLARGKNKPSPDQDREKRTETARSQRVESKLFLVSSRRIGSLDNFSSGEIGAIVLKAETGMNILKLKSVLDTTKKGHIPDLLIIEPWAYARKVRRYNDLKVYSYGWTKNDLRQAYPASPSALPYVEWGTDDSLSQNEIKVGRIVLSRDWITPYFEDLQLLVPRLLRTGGVSANATIYGLYRDCLRLAVPIGLYDDECMGSFYRQPISRRIEMLSEQISQIPAEVSSADYRKAELTLSEIAKALADKGNKKFDSLLLELRTSLAALKPCAFILLNSQERLAFEKALSRLEYPIGHEILDKIGILIGSFDALPKVELSWKLEQVTFSTYPPLKRVDDVSEWLSQHSTRAMVILRRQEAEELEFYSRDSESVRDFLFSETRRRSIAESVLVGKQYEPVEIPRTEPVTIAEPAAEVVPKQTSEKDILRILLDFEERGTLPQHQSLTYVSDAPTLETRPGLLIRLENGRTIALQPSKYVNVYTEDGKSRVVKSSRLQSGQMIILVNQSTKQSLNELILERVSAYPKFKMLERSVRKWIKTLREGMNKTNDTPTTLLRKLRDRGSRITTPTAIYFWRMGLIIGPKDFEDIKRIAAIYESEELAQNFSGVTKAIVDFRHLKIQILHSVKRSLLSLEKGEFEELQIELSDFTDAIEIVRIATIETQKNISNESFNKVGELIV